MDKRENSMNKYDFQMKFFNFYCLFYLTTMWLHSKRSVNKTREYQNKQIKKLIKRAYEIPFYRERFEKTGILPNEIKTVEDLCKLPTLTKEQYREWMLEELKTEEAKHYKLTYTSGSTGIPTTNIFPPKEYAQHYMMDMFCWIKGGYNPFWGKTLTCAAGDASVGQSTFIQKLGILRRECFSMEWDRSKIIEKINDYKPDFILGYSAELSYIAQYATENGIKVHKPKFYCAGGEHVMGEQQRLLENVFGKGMINYYGCTEMADFAYRAPGSDEYGILEDCVALCVKSCDGLSTEGEGSILATPLYRLRYPLINYEIGDNVRLEIKEGSLSIPEINGRIQDIFYWRSGKRTTHKDFWLVSRKLEGIYQIRFIQESEVELVIQAVKDKNCEKDICQVEKYLAENYKPLIDDDVKISFEWFEEIPPDSSGKIRNMISKL